MKFISDFHVISTVIIIALTGITNSKVAWIRLNEQELNSTSVLTHWSMGDEPPRRARRKATGPCIHPEIPPNFYWQEFDGFQNDGFFTIELLCEDGYTSHFEADIFCGNGGEWVYAPQCVGNSIPTVPPSVARKFALPFCLPRRNGKHSYWLLHKSQALGCGRKRYCDIPPWVMFWSRGAHLHQACDDGYANHVISYCNIYTGDWTTKPVCTANDYRTKIARRLTQSQLRCPIPLQPKNGLWRLDKSQCQKVQHCDFHSNVTELDPGTHLILTCNYGYKVNGTADVYCGHDGKLSKAPECIEIRCEPLSTDSTKAKCSYNDAWIPCQSPVPLDTIAIVSCRDNYRSDPTVLSRRRPIVRCNGKGQWDPEPIQCTPECGKIPSGTEPMIVGGQIARIPEFPWHATLYKAAPNGHKKMICGATIIQRNLLITAAHCVVDGSYNRVEEPSKFAVATGNIFRDFDSPLHQPGVVKTANVKRIAVNCNYVGYAGNYDWDIAILQIEQPFAFTSILMPVCLDLSEFSDRFDLEVGNFGKFAGFGRTAMGTLSEVLQTLTIPYVSLSVCRASSNDSDDEKFITTDKFCAGYRNGSGACDGDSGGGLVFKTYSLWYLRGVVSGALGQTVSGVKISCEKGSYSLYTKISSHGQWIQGVIDEFERFNTLS